MLRSTSSERKHGRAQNVSCSPELQLRNFSDIFTSYHKHKPLLSSTPPIHLWLDCNLKDLLSSFLWI